MVEMMKDAFSGPGVVLLQIMGVAVGSWLVGQICRALNRADLAQYAHVASVFIVFAIVITTIINALTKMAQVMGY
jgi:uncharacterized membrane protein YcjF (UPF0283 family)